MREKPKANDKLLLSNVYFKRYNRDPKVGDEAKCQFCKAPVLRLAVSQVKLFEMRGA